MEPLALLFFVAVLYWVWSDSLKARERAIGLSFNACRQLEMQFLDQTVGLKSLGLGRHTSGRVALRRVFGFEFSSDGADRRQGQVTMLGQKVEAIYMELPDGGTYLDSGVVRPLQLH